MSMLAESKRKSKWTLNPRGKQWTNDDTNIGHKLLEKMGWAKGKGLGREEQGDLEPIRLKYKKDSEGVGYQVKDDQWVEHREQFNNILSALNGNDGLVNEIENVSVKSLETRSKCSKSRVHYHKFTRGKDLSRYSASDLACILGKRVQSEKTEEKSVQNMGSREENNRSETENFYGITTIQRGSIQEYFAAKMAAVNEKQSQNSILESEIQPLPYDGENNFDEKENEKRVRINENLNIVNEFFSQQKILNAKDSTLEETTIDIQKKKKKKKAKFEGVEFVSDASLVTKDQSSSKHKKRKETEGIVSNSEIINKSEKETLAQSKKSKKKRKINEVLLDAVAGGEEAYGIPQKKKKKKKNIDEETPVNLHVLYDAIDPTQAPNNPNLIRMFEGKQLNAGLKQKCTQMFAHVTIDKLSVSSIEERSWDIPKKKKKKSKTKLEDVKPVMNDSFSTQDQVAIKQKKENNVAAVYSDTITIDKEMSRKHKKSRKRIKEQVVSNSNQEGQQIDGTAHVKKEKKSKKNTDAEPCSPLHAPSC